MAKKRKDFTQKKKERENFSKKMQFWIGMFISLIFFRLKIGKVKSMLSQFASIRKT